MSARVCVDGCGLGLLTLVLSVLGRDLGGFNFDLAHRNALLRRTGLKMPGATKTGTTIVGVQFEVSYVYCR